MSSFDTINVPEVELVERATSRTLLQFRQSPVFLNVLQALVQEVSTLQTAIVDVMNLRGPNDAVGVNLDAIGRIVGQTREIYDYVALSWFTTDTAGLAIDQAPQWVENAPLSGLYFVEDPWFRELIAARVMRNFANYGSVPEIQAVIQQALGYTPSFYLIGLMDVQLVVNSNTPEWIIYFIIHSTDSSRCDGVMFAPFPATLRITGVYYCPDNAFSVDVNSIDYSAMAVDRDV